MKKLIMMLLAVMWLLIPARTVAQNNVVKAIDRLVSNKSYAQYITSIISQDNDMYTGKAKSYYYYYALEMPLNKQGALTDLRTAFEKDLPRAYSSLVKMAGTVGSGQMRIAYGEDLEKSVTFGSRPENNYIVMTQADPTDSLRRFAYALVWNANKSTDKLKMQIYKIYSKNPQKNVNRRVIINRFNTKNFQKSLDSLYKSLPYDLNEINIGDWSVRSGSGKDSLQTEFDFLNRFSSLRTAYKRMYKRISFQTAIANQLISLCRDYGRLLSPHLREVCIAELRDMKSGVKDKFLTGLLDEAILKLK